MDKTVSLFRRECHFCICRFRIGGKNIASDNTNGQHRRDRVIMELFVPTFIYHLVGAENRLPGFCFNACGLFLFHPSMDVQSKNLYQSMSISNLENCNFTRCWRLQWGAYFFSSSFLVRLPLFHRNRAYGVRSFGCRAIRCLDRKPFYLPIRARLAKSASTSLPPLKMLLRLGHSSEMSKPRWLLPSNPSLTAPSKLNYNLALIQSSPKNEMAYMPTYLTKRITSTQSWSKTGNTPGGLLRSTMTLRISSFIR